MIDHGKVVADGTSDEHKDRVGGERLEVKLDDDAFNQKAIEILGSMSDEDPFVEGESVKLTVRERRGAIVEAVQKLNEAGVGIDDIGLRRPTLDEVFLSLTGHALETEDDETQEDGK